MRKLSNKNKLLIIIFIIVLTIIEIFLIHNFQIRFKGIYKSTFYLMVIYLQVIIWYGLLYKPKSKKFPKFSLWASIIVCSFTFVLLIMLQPKYDYDDAVSLVENEIDDSGYVLSTYIKGYNTVPITSDSNEVLIANKYYYLRFINNNSERFFAVSPIDGRILELEEDFYGDIPIF